VLHLLVLAGVACGASAMKWESCSHSSFTPSDVSLKPDPPVTGKDVTFSIAGDYAPEGTLQASSM
jgi:hypothetical protein